LFLRERNNPLYESTSRQPLLIVNTQQPQKHLKFTASPPLLFSTCCLDEWDKFAFTPPFVLRVYSGSPRLSILISRRQDLKCNLVKEHISVTVNLTITPVFHTKFQLNRYPTHVILLSSTFPITIQPAVGGWRGGGADTVAPTHPRQGVNPIKFRPCNLILVTNHSRSLLALCHGSTNGDRGGLLLKTRALTSSYCSSNPRSTSI